jgi:hypothetical protein
LGLDAAIADLSDRELDFGIVGVGLDSVRSLKIYNRGARALTIRSPFLYPAQGPFSYTPSTPMVTIPAGDSVVFRVRFAPTLQDSFESDQRFPHDGNWGMEVVWLHGIGNTLLGNAGLPVENIYKLYPNPAQDMVTVSCTVSFESNAQIVLSDIMGRDLLSQNLEEGHFKANISLKNLPPGLYACRLVQSGKTEIIGKLVVE